LTEAGKKVSPLKDMLVLGKHFTMFSLRNYPAVVRNALWVKVVEIKSLVYRWYTSGLKISARILV
jgi:hypothetical protein